ncbi:MAG: hypothetical protein AAGG38_03160 [Planctomycetota bacterium]
MLPVRRIRDVVVCAGILCVSLTGCEAPEIGDEPVAVELQELPPGVADAYRQLTGSTAGLGERAAAASTLIEIDDFSADRALAAALSRSQPEPVWRATLQAVATEEDQVPRGLWRPMLTLLYTADDALVPDLARALGRYQDPAMTQRLRETAASSTLPTRERRRAIAALAEQRTSETAALLVGLTALTQPAEVQNAAYAALTSLTGLERLGEDRRAWAQWWDQARRLDDLAWNRQLVQNLVRQQNRGSVTEQRLAEQLREAERSLYLTSSVEDQPGVLAYMLSRPLVDTRLLALDLAQTRLIAGGRFDPSLRAALRDQLGDPDSAEVRRQVADLLRDLADAPSADLVAQRLINDEEHVARVQSSYLQLLARLPRKEASEAAFRLLEEPGLRADASAALAAIERDGMLTPKRSAAVLERLRSYLVDASPPSPQTIRLLGRIGSNEEWQRIEAWIDHPDDVTRQAAAQAWADATDRSLAILAERAGDPIIQPIVLRAASERGRDPETLRRLVDNPPQQSQVVPAWERALVAMAERVDAGLSLNIAAQLQRDRQDLAFLERFYTAAIDGHEPTYLAAVRGDGAPETTASAAGSAEAVSGSADARPPGPAAGSAPTDPAGSTAAVANHYELRLRRGENRLAMQEPDLAVIDFEWLLTQQSAVLDDPTRQSLASHQRDRLYAGLIPAYLRAGRVEPAFRAARAYFADPANPGVIDPAATDHPLMIHFIDAGHRAADLGRTETATALLDGLRLLHGPEPSYNLELAARMRRLEDKLAAPAPASDSATP